MKKILAIGLKDLQLLFRDRGALVLMLLAPFLLTLGFGFVSGAFDDDDGQSGIRDIPVLYVNQDAGELGNRLQTLFESEQLDTLIALTATDDIAAARTLVDDDEAAALVIVPAGFSAGLLPDQDSGETALADPIEIYRSTARPVSTSVIDSIVSSFVQQVESNVSVVTLSIDQLIASNQADRIPDLLEATNNADQLGADVITVNQAVGEQEDSAEFNIFALLAPGMALMFLMYTVSLGATSILTEQENGTMARMRTTTTSASQILAGKIAGIFLSGIAQTSILVIASALLLGNDWGDWLGVALLIVSAAIAASGWGVLFASLLKTPAQVATAGSSVMIVFAAISGTFVQFDGGLIDMIGRISPNKWAIDGFIDLAQGSTTLDILPSIGALWIMAAILFAIAIPMCARKSTE